MVMYGDVFHKCNTFSFCSEILCLSVTIIQHEFQKKYRCNGTGRSSDTTKDAGSGSLVCKCYWNIGFPTSLYLCSVLWWWEGKHKQHSSTFSTCADKAKEQGHPQCIGNLLRACGLHLICIKNTEIAPAFILTRGTCGWYGQQLILPGSPWAGIS